MAADLDLSIVIPCYNDERRLPGSLEQLHRCEMRRDLLWLRLHQAGGIAVPTLSGHREAGP